MDKQLRQLLIQLLDRFEMDGGEWPCIEVNTSLYGPVWGAVDSEMQSLLMDIYCEVHNED